jgi:hypothetical protein
MPFPPTPSITPSNTPTSSITPSNTPTNTPSGTQCPGLSPTPTNTLTPTITPSSTPPPLIYINLCIPSTLPFDGFVPLCFYSQTTPDCNGTRINITEEIFIVGDLYVIYEGEPISICGGFFGSMSADTSCNCSSGCIFESGTTGITLSAVTYGLYPPTLPTNYVIGNVCYDDCLPCETPTPTPTVTQTPSVTPTLTPTTTPSPTPICCYQYEITNYYTTSQTIFFTNCDGTPGSVSAAGNGLQTIVNCAVQDSLSTSANICDGGTTDCVTWVQANTPCGGCV